MAYDVLMGTLNPTHSLTHSLTHGVPWPHKLLLDDLGPHAAEILGEARSSVTTCWHNVDLLYS